MKNLTLDPPRYKALGQRCASVAARVLRAGKVIGNDSKLFHGSPFQLRRYLEKKLKDFKTYGSKTKRQLRRESKKIRKN